MPSVTPFTRSFCFRYMEQAVEAAFQIKSLDDLNYIGSKCGNDRAILEKVNLYKSQLTQKR